MKYFTLVGSNWSRYLQYLIRMVYFRVVLCYATLK